MKCAKCGAAMYFTGKDTLSGDEIREYRCATCGHEDSESGGPALWRVMQENKDEAPL